MMPQFSSMTDQYALGTLSHVGSVVLIVACRVKSLTIEMTHVKNPKQKILVTSSFFLSGKCNA